MWRGWLLGWAGRNGRRAVRADRRGAAATEFAILSGAYIVMAFGTMEMLFSLYAQNVLDFGMKTAVRQIQVGNAQGYDSATLKSSVICPALNGLIDCGSIYVRVLPLTSSQDYYNNTTGQIPISSNQLNVGTWTVCPGTPSTPMYIQMIYAGPTFVGGFIPSWSVKDPNGVYAHPIYSSAGWVNEPYTQTASQPSGC